MKTDGAIEQIIGREGETATFLSRCLVSLNLCVIGFAPRQFNRSALRVENLGKMREACVRSTARGFFLI